jgi:hypothetical protein
MLFEFELQVRVLNMIFDAVMLLIYILSVRSRCFDDYAKNVESGESISPYNYGTESMLSVKL